MEDPEVIINLWYLIDSETGYTYSVSGRAYVAVGTDEDKLDLLRRLAPTDYLIAKQFPVPCNFEVIGPGGDRARLAAIGNYELRQTNLFEEVFKALDNEIPRRIQWINGEKVITKLKVPQEPLCVFTPLIEDDEGIRPRITLHPRN